MGDTYLFPNEQMMVNSARMVANGNLPGGGNPSLPQQQQQPPGGNPHHQQQPRQALLLQQQQQRQRQFQLLQQQQQQQQQGNSRMPMAGDILSDLGGGAGGGGNALQQQQQQALLRRQQQQPQQPSYLSQRAGQPQSMQQRQIPINLTPQQQQQRQLALEQQQQQQQLMRLRQQQQRASAGLDLGALGSSSSSFSGVGGGGAIGLDNLNRQQPPAAMQHQPPQRQPGGGGALVGGRAGSPALGGGSSMGTGAALATSTAGFHRGASVGRVGSGNNLSNLGGGGGGGVQRGASLGRGVDTSSGGSGASGLGTSANVVNRNPFPLPADKKVANVRTEGMFFFDKVSDNVPGILSHLRAFQLHNIRHEAEIILKDAKDRIAMDAADVRKLCQSSQTAKTSYQTIQQQVAWANQFETEYAVDLSVPIEAVDNEVNLVNSALPLARSAAPAAANTPRGSPSASASSSRFTPKAKGGGNTKNKQPSASPEAKRGASASRGGNDKKNKNGKRGRQRAKAKEKDADASSSSPSAQPGGSGTGGDHHPQAFDVEDDFEDDDGSDDDYKDSDDGNSRKKKKVKRKPGSRAKPRRNQPSNPKNRSRKPPHKDDAASSLADGASSSSSSLSAAPSTSAPSSPGIGGGLGGGKGLTGGHSSSSMGGGGGAGNGGGPRSAGRNRRRTTASLFGQRLMGRSRNRTSEQLPVYAAGAGPNGEAIPTTGMKDDKWWVMRSPLVGYPEDRTVDELKKEIENHKQYDNSDDHLGKLGDEHWVEKWMRQDNLPELTPEERKVLHKNCYEGESAEPREFYKNLVPPQDRDAVFKHSMTQRLIHAQIDMLHRNQHPFDIDKLKNAPKDAKPFTDENLRPKSMKDFDMEVDDAEWTPEKQARDAELAKACTAEDRTLFELADIGFLDVEMDDNGHAVVKDEDKLLEGKDRTDDEVCIFIRDYCGMLQNASYELEKLGSKLLSKVGDKSNRKKYFEMLRAEEKVLREVSDAFFKPPTNDHFHDMKEDVVSAALADFQKTIAKTGSFRELTGFKFNPDDYEGPPKNGSENYQDKMARYPAPDDSDDEEASTPRGGARTPGGASTPGSVAASPPASSSSASAAAAAAAAAQHQRQKDAALAARAAALSASRSRSRSLVRGGGGANANSPATAVVGGGGTGQKGIGSKGVKRRRAHAQKGLPSGMMRVNAVTAALGGSPMHRGGGVMNSASMASLEAQMQSSLNNLGGHGNLGGLHSGLGNLLNQQGNQMPGGQVQQNLALQQQQQRHLQQQQYANQIQQQRQLQMLRQKQHQQQQQQQQQALLQQQAHQRGVGGGVPGNMYGAQQGGFGGTGGGGMGGSLGGLRTGAVSHLGGGGQQQLGGAGGLMGNAGGGLGGGGFGSPGGLAGGGGLGALAQTPSRPALGRQPSAGDDLLQSQLDALAGNTPPLPNQPGLNNFFQ